MVSYLIENGQIFAWEGINNSFIDITALIAKDQTLRNYHNLRYKQIVASRDDSSVILCVSSKQCFDLH